MKLLKKAVSLMMAAIMFFATSPVLQAADFVNDLDMAKLKELQKGIAASFPKIEVFESNEYTIPDAQTIQKRYQKAVENNQRMLDEADGDETSTKEKEKYVYSLIDEAVKRVENNPEYYGNKSKEEMLSDALREVLFDEMKQSALTEQKYENAKFEHYVGSAIVTVLIFIESIGIAHLIGATSSIAILFTSICAAGVSLVSMLALTDPAKPYFSPNLSPEQAKYQFIKNPTKALASFNKRGVDDFQMFYSKSEDCASVLNDAVDIEYYSSLNPTTENMLAHLYTQTRYWRDLAPEIQETYLHNTAERLRAEAKRNIKEKSNSMKIGLEER